MTSPQIIQIFELLSELPNLAKNDAPKALNWDTDKVKSLLGLLEELGEWLADDVMILGDILGSESVVNQEIPTFGFLVRRIGSFQSAACR